MSSGLRGGGTGRSVRRVRHEDVGVGLDVEPGVDPPPVGSGQDNRRSVPCCRPSYETRTRTVWIDGDAHVLTCGEAHDSARRSEADSKLGAYGHAGDHGSQNQDGTDDRPKAPIQGV